MKIILAFDSFKGSLTAEEAVEAARRGVLAACPGAQIISLPLADGGEGTAAALGSFLEAEWQECEVCDPLFRKIHAHYGISSDGDTAIMEMASAAGLTLLKEEERNPMKTTTFGVGEMILDAIRRGCRHILIGIGGSATNDGGMGMLTALGVRFLDENSEVLKPIGENLLKIKHIDWSGLIDLSGVTINVACDVRNPLFGRHGAAFVYAPQKGAGVEDVETLDRGLCNFANHCPIRFRQQAETTGSGAAGGLGFGLLLIGAKLRRGVDVILDAARLDHHLQGADLIITGEGKIDQQTLNGKLPFGIMQRAKAHGVPTIALAGQVEDTTLLLRAGFHSLCPINPSDLPTSAALFPATAKENLLQATAKAIYTFITK